MTHFMSTDFKHIIFFHSQSTPMDVNASQLQHGLVRWVQNYGEHILKTLIARSPKLPHPRRYSNSMLPGGGASASPMNGHGCSNGTSGGIGGLGGGGGGGVGGAAGGGRPPRPSGFGRANKFSSREGMLIPPAYLPSAPFRPHTYPLLGSPTSIYYGMVPSLPAAAVGQMSPTGANTTSGSGSAGAGYPTAAGVSGMPNVNQAGVLVPVPQPAVASTMGTPLSLDSSAISGPTQQQPSQNILFMQPLGLPHQHPQQPHLQVQVTLSGSPIQQQEFTRPSSPIGFKPPPPIAALSGPSDREGGGAGGGTTGGVAGSEGSVSLMSSIQQQQAHLIQTQGLVTMTPIMAASASPSSSLNLSHAGMHHVQPHPLSSQQLQAQLHLHQQQAAGSTFGGGVASGSGLFEHMPQIQQTMRPGLAAAALPPVSSVFQEQHAITHPPTAPQHQQQQQPLIAQFHHSGIITGATLGSGEGVSGAASTTGTGTTNLPLMPLPSYPLSTGGGGVVLPGGQRNESEPLLPNPPIPPLQPAKHVTSVAAGTGGGIGVGGAGGGASHHGSGSQSSSMRKEIPCKHFIAGTCPFGEKCWFAHLMPITREGPGGSRGATSQPLGSPSSGPLQVQIPPNLWINNPNLLFDLSHFAVASPPQSPVNSTLISGNRPPILPTLIRPRAYYPNFPGQQPLLLVRPPGGTATVFPAGVQGVGMGVPGAIGGGAGGGYPFYAHTGQYPTLQPQINPILKFNLLSEVVVRQIDDTDMVMENITKMITRADHIYIAYGQTINDYKILFGGNRSFQESAILIERKMIAEAVSCLHFSKQQPTLMVIGTMFGSIYTWDIRKGATGGMVTAAHKAEVC